MQTKYEYGRESDKDTIIMDLKEYISTVNQKYRAGNATEHSYRGALEQLIQTLLPKLRIVNEPKRVKCGAPDYIAINPFLQIVIGT